nr:MAG TPA: hypothetical protein [Caudoviricetes sp.]
MPKYRAYRWGGKLPPHKRWVAFRYTPRQCCPISGQRHQGVSRFAIPFAVKGTAFHSTLPNRLPLLYNIRQVLSIKKRPHPQTLIDKYLFLCYNNHIKGDCHCRGGRPIFKF